MSNLVRAILYSCSDGNIISRPCSGGFTLIGDGTDKRFGGGENIIPFSIVEVVRGIEGVRGVGGELISKIKGGRVGW